MILERQRVLELAQSRAVTVYGDAGP
jgi:hypothetical protein